MQNFTQMIILAQSTLDKVVRLIECDKVELKDVEAYTNRLMDIQIKLSTKKSK